MASPTEPRPRSTQYIHLVFDPPVDLPEWKYVAKGDVATEFTSEELYGIASSGGGDLGFVESPDDTLTAGLPTPTNLHIVSQTVRTAQGGTQLVDVVLGFDSVDGATSYNVRVAALD